MNARCEQTVWTDVCEHVAHHAAVVALDALIQRRLDRLRVVVHFVTDGAILRDIEDRWTDRGAHASQSGPGLPVGVRAGGLDRLDGLEAS